MSNRADARPRSTRGLTAIPPTNTRKSRKYPEDETYTVGRVRRKVKQRMFTLGMGLDLPLLILICVLVALGLVMLFSASYASAYYEFGDSYMFIKRQGMFAVVGIIAMLLISTFNYHKFHKLALPLFGITMLFLIVVVAFRDTPIAPLKGGDASRWLDLGFVEFQPSELAKFTLVVMLADIISRAGDGVKTFRHGVLPCMGCTAVVAALVMAEKHVSATLIILAIACIVMFVGGIKPRWFVVLGGVAGTAVVYMVFFSDKFAYALQRVKGWIDPFNPPEGVDTYQTRQSLYAIGSGRLLGVGLGQSRQKYLYLPEPQNDFIFAIVCEELGFIGALVVILLFAMLIWRGVYISLNAKDKFGTLIGLGTTFTVGIQAVLNICVVTNAIPNTGISLPFFSYGGTSLLMLLGEMGVLLSVSRGSYLEKS